ncbi:ACT domain-containing protein [Vibrio splendidus]|uniref:ACT domain-containing protein n=1 Tax=Vibrio splendidus TaxID=29497 RepID=UPI0009788894|nr:ACT domain-containing protein [Vibrio splendidus]OMO25359.1 transporter [Vibrio splendidus]PMH06202.1 transporter [Vibrio splendidus]PMI72115.1 transporter [Vibrio splendidus]PMK17020.1 transporter [Vibrio splendidus]PMK59898.1 transporter [Vibrio splendidus]|tara:strand:+ start:39 stop:440 length:402 start_codon:yes stop_codon:yes gene_type:complete
MTAITDLDVLLKSMSPELIEGNYVFCTVDGALTDYVQLNPISTFREKEGLTLVLEENVATRALLDFDGIFSLITLSVHSSLEAVGLTAAFATKLGSYGISANVIAGYYHDHIFVQKEKADEAMSALREFSKAD